MILQLTNEALEKKLKLKKLDAYYILGSQEIILLQEARELIWSTARQLGFQTRHVVEMSTSVDWDQLYYQYNTNDLFEKYQFIEFRCLQLPNESMGQKLHRFVTAYQAHSALKRIVVLSGHFKANMARPNWFEQMTQHSTVVFLLSPSQHSLEQWIRQRLHKNGLSLTQEAIGYLAQGTEGNLNAAIQSIEKLTLIYRGIEQPLSKENLQSILQDEAEFVIFALNEAILQSDYARTARILFHFESANIGLPLILGCVLRLLRSIAALYYSRSQQALSSLFQEYKIWPKHQAAFQRAISIVQKKDLYQLFNQAYQIDRYIKGVEKGDSWNHLEKFCFQLCQYFQSGEGFKV